MVTDGSRESKRHDKLGFPRALLNAGVPLVIGPLDKEGNPSGREWDDWQHAEPSRRVLSRWEPGMAIAAVSGHGVDGLDHDPRNDPERTSVKKLIEALGDDGPVILGKTRTASGGKHLYIASLGLPKKIGLLPGIDYLGGAEDGSGRSLIFLPPTVRPSKLTGKPTAYRVEQPFHMNGDAPCERLAELITEGFPSQVAGQSRNRGGTQPVSERERECLNAPDGSQRDALLRLVQELERQSDDNEYVVWRTLRIVERMPQYDKRKPWREAHVRGLLHEPGKRPMANAPEGEIGTAMVPHVRAGGLQSYSTIEREQTKWMWNRHVAFGDSTIVDGNAGLGKSLLTLDVAARLSKGRPMPGEAESHLPREGLPVLLLAPEDRPAVTALRLDAALADTKKIFRPPLGTTEIERRDKEGRHREKRATYEGSMLVFPDAIQKFKRWIREYDIKLVVIDPISAFLSEKTNSNNDASVRRALEPLAEVLGELNCAAILIRHLNKNTSQQAQHRGGGSVAFGAVARIQLLAGEQADGSYAIGQLKNNHLERRPDKVLQYTIVDSDIVADNDGNMVPRIQWGEFVDGDVNTLASVGDKKKGPQATAQLDIEEVLKELFDTQDTWPAKEVVGRLKDEGCSTTRTTVTTVREKLGIRADPVYKPGGGFDYWNWTTVPQKYGRRHRKGG